MPIRRKMSPLYNILLTKKVKSLKHEAGSRYANQTIEISNILENLRPLYSEYCNEIYGAKCDIGCPAAITLFYEDKQYPFKLEKFQHNGRALYTANSGPKIRNFLWYNEGNQLE
jgi:hypothetical protein